MMNFTLSLGGEIMENFNGLFCTFLYFLNISQETYFILLREGQQTTKRLRSIGEEHWVGLQKMCVFLSLTPCVPAANPIPSLSFIFPTDKTTFFIFIQAHKFSVFFTVRKIVIFTKLHCNFYM